MNRADSVSEKEIHMAKMNLEELRKLRDDKKKELVRRDSDGKTIQVTVGMGTCGIAAGAKGALESFIKELDEQGITNAVVKQTGCMGLCYAEPTVEISMEGMPTVIYGKVTSDVARDIVKKHIVGKTLLNNLIYDKPAADIVQK